MWYICIWFRVAAMMNQLPAPSKGATMEHRHTEISISLAMVTVSLCQHVFCVAYYMYDIYTLDYKLALKEFTMV